MATTTAHATTNTSSDSSRRRTASAYNPCIYRTKAAHPTWGRQRHLRLRFRLHFVWCALRASSWFRLAHVGARCAPYFGVVRSARLILAPTFISRFFLRPFCFLELMRTLLPLVLRVVVILSVLVGTRVHLARARSQFIYFLPHLPRDASKKAEPAPVGDGNVQPHAASAPAGSAGCTALLAHCCISCSHPDSFREHREVVP